MKIRVELYPAILSVVFMLLLSFPQTLLSQEASPTGLSGRERLAVVSKYEGDVKVQHETLWKTIKQIGNRIRNSAVYEEDSVMTMHASTADLVFNDNTSLEIDEDTSLTISTREMSGEEEAEGVFIRKVSGKQGGVVRNIHVKAGKFLANITPSKSVLTEFETPTGVASVRGTMFTLAYVGGVTSIDLTQGLVDFASTGNDINFSIEPGDAVNISTPEFGRTSVGVKSGQIDVKTNTGTLKVESGESTGVEVDAVTGVVTVTAEAGTIDCEMKTGTAVIEEGAVAGTKVNEDTGAVSVSSKGGKVEFKNAMGKVVMGEGDVMGAHMDAETGDIFMTAEEGTIAFETSGGTASLEKGEIVGTAFDQDTGKITMTAKAGDVSFDTPMGMAVMQEGAVMQVTFDDNTGEMSMSSAGGTYTLETGNGIITMEDGGSMDFTVDHNTGEITVTGIEGDVVMTNEDGTTTTIEAGTSLGIMHDEGHDGPMGPDKGPGGDGPDDGHDGPGPDGDHDGMGPEDFEGTYKETDEGGVYEGTFTDEDGTFEGTYTDSSGVFDGTYIDDTGTYIGAYNETDGVFTGTFVDAYTGGTFEGTFTDFGFTGMYTDSSGNVYTFTDFQQSSFYSDQAEIDNAQQHPGTPTQQVTDNVWDDGWNAYTTNSFGPIVTTTTPNSNTGTFQEYFGSDAGFAVIHTGFGSNQNNGFIEKVFNFGSGAMREFSFDYNFITTEFIGANAPDDVFLAQLILSNSTVITLARESVLASSFSPVGGLPYDTLDNSVGNETGWLTSYDYIFVPSGITKLRFSVTDAEDSFVDSAVLLDNVVDPPVAASSTDYLLTFARMLSGEVGIHDADLAADAVASAEHQAFIDKVNEVISDMENISDSEFFAGKDEFLDRLWVARDSLADHEDTAGFLQQTGVAHNLLEAGIMTDEGIGTNITSIQDSLNQAKTFLVAHINDFGETDSLSNIRTQIDSVLANIDNVNNNEFTTATIVAIRDGIKQAFSDTIDHMNGDGHQCGSTNHIECTPPS